MMPRASILPIFICCTDWPSEASWFIATTTGNIQEKEHHTRVEGTIGKSLILHNDSIRQSDQNIFFVSRREVSFVSLLGESRYSTVWNLLKNIWRDEERCSTKTVHFPRVREKIRYISWARVTTFDFWHKRCVWKRKPTCSDESDLSCSP